MVRMVPSLLSASLTRVERDDRLAADTLDLSAREAPVAGCGDRIPVGVDELELDGDRAEVENENVHVTTADLL